MKRLLIALSAVCSVSLAADPDEEFHRFCTTDGQSVTAKIVNFDATTGKVMVQRQDRKTVTVDSAIFSDEDRAYIASWSEVNAFQSPSKVDIVVKRHEVKNWKNDKTVDSDGGWSSGMTLYVDKFEEYKFNIVIHNKNPFPLNNVGMEYKIFYDQQKTVDAKAVDESRVKTGREKIDSIAAGETREISTASVTIQNRTTGGGGHSSMSTLTGITSLKGSIEGAWVRITLKTDDGQKAVRDVTLPNSLLKKKKWDDAD